MEALFTLMYLSVYYIHYIDTHLHECYYISINNQASHVLYSKKLYIIIKKRKTFAQL